MQDLDIIALDRWLTTEPESDEEWDEYDPPCPMCKAVMSDHLTVQIVDEAEGVDYESQVCPI